MATKKPAAGKPAKTPPGDSKPQSKEGNKAGKTQSKEGKPGAKGKEQKYKLKICGENGPGPYTLPPVLGYKNHDITRYRYPAFTTPGRGHSLKAFVSPGPANYNPGNFNRFGSKFSPQVTFNKRAEHRKKDVGPGPAAYNLGKSTALTQKTIPAFSIKSKPKELKKAVGPGPASYNINDRLLYSTIPKATIKSRTPYKDASLGPGPSGGGVPKWLGKKTPAAVITGRPKDPKVFAGPGPGKAPSNLMGPRVPVATIIGRPDPCIKPFVDKNVEVFEFKPHPLRIPL